MTASRAFVRSFCNAQDIYPKGERKKAMNEQTEQKQELELIRASDITPKEISWLWYPFIPYGKVTLLQGDPGDGKSTFMLTLAALLTKGSPQIGRAHV